MDTFRVGDKVKMRDLTSAMALALNGQLGRIVNLPQFFQVPGHIFQNGGTNLCLSFSDGIVKSIEEANVVLLRDRACITKQVRKGVSPHQSRYNTNATLDG